MSWNERRAFSRSSATICWSISSRSTLSQADQTQRIALVGSHRTQGIIKATPDARGEPMPPRDRHEATPPSAAAPADRLHAAQRHRPRRAVRRQRRPGRVLLRARLRLPARRLRRPRDRPARPRLARARAGPDPPRPDRHAALGHRDRPPPRPPRRRRPLDRALGPRRRPGLRRGARARGARRRRSRTTVSDEHGAGPPRERSPTYGDTLHTFVDRSGYDGAFLPGLRARSPARRPPHDEMLLGDRPHRRQRRARPHGGVGPLLRAGLRDGRDDPLLRRGDLDRVLGADVEGRRLRQRPHQVPDQRAGRGPAQVPDRRVPRVLRGRGRPAHRGRDARHRRHRRRAAPPRRRLPDDPRRLLRRGPRAGARRSRTSSPTCASRASWSTTTTRAICSRSSPSRSATGRRCSSRSSSATAPPGFGAGNFKALFEAIEREQERRGNL